MDCYEIGWRSSPAHYGLANAIHDRTPNGQQVTNKLPCLVCGKQLTSLAMEIHRCNAVGLDSTGDEFPFPLLPGGISDSKREFDRHRSDITKKWEAELLDWERIRELELLKPIGPGRPGQGGWSDYCLYEFAGSNFVVLETPVRNNATYILGANWLTMISLTKSEIRAEFKGKYTKIVHRTNWRERVEKTLNRNPPARSAISGHSC